MGSSVALESSLMDSQTRKIQQCVGRRESFDSSRLTDPRTVNDGSVQIPSNSQYHNDQQSLRESRGHFGLRPGRPVVENPVMLSYDP